MKIETKTYIIIMITLIIGVVIGALITGAVVHHRVRRFMDLGQPEHLAARIERIIGPEATQREAVRQILLEHSERFIQVHSQFEGEMLALRDSLKKDLDPLLTEEQKQRLEQHPKPPRHLKGRNPGPHRRFETPDEAPPGKRGPYPPPPPEGDDR